MPDPREDYNDQFIDSTWAHYLIRRVDPSKDGDTNLAVLLDSKIKITPLKAVVNFLKTNFALKYPDFVEPLNTGKPTKTKAELANQIIDFVKKTVPHLCQTCDTNYAPYIDNRSDGEDDDPAVTCFLCEVPAHAACIKGNSINHNQGIVYLCSTCYSSKGKSEAIITDKTGIPKQDPTVDEDSDSDESEITPYQKPTVEEKSSKAEKLMIKTKKLTKKRHSKSSQHIMRHSETEEDDTSSESEEPSNLCPEYKWGKCHQFNTCPYDHPPRCWSWLQHGKCPYKKKCRYNHPPLCRYSRRERQCYNIDCKFFHLYGTKRNKDEQQPSDRRRMNSGSDNQNQRSQARAHERSAQDINLNQRQSAPTSNSNSDNDRECSPEMTFLVKMIKELKEELQKDISDIRNDMNKNVTQEENQSTQNVAPQSHVQPDPNSQQYYPQSAYNYDPYAQPYQMYQRWYYHGQ